MTRHRASWLTKTAELLATFLKVLVALLAVGALLSADFLSVQVTQNLLDDGRRKDVLAVVLTIITLVSIVVVVRVQFQPKLEKLWKWLSVKKLWQQLPKIDDNLRRNSLSFDRIFSFCVFMIVAVITSYFAWKHLSQDDPASKVVIGLLTATFVALLFALWGRDLVRRLQKVGTAGIEFGTWQEIARIPELAEPPRPHFNTESDPWGNTPLSSKQRWFYERGSSLLSHLDHLGVNTDELKGAELRRYRGLVLWVGIAALNERQSEKALEILKTIEYQQNLDYEEIFYLGAAYLWVALDDKDPDSRAEKLDRSARLLARAVKTQPKQAAAHWNLGRIYFELEMYDESVMENEAVIKLGSEQFLHWAYWMLAAIHLKRNQRQAALNALEQIGPGDRWWKIWEDKDLKKLQVNLRFQSLVATGLSG